MRRFVSSSTKAAVKALDTVTFFLTDDTAPDEIQTIGLNPTKFFVGGASKRGWTTWSTASVDSRQATSCKKRKNKQNIIPFNFQQCLSFSVCKKITTTWFQSDWSPPNCHGRAKLHREPPAPLEVAGRLDISVRGLLETEPDHLSGRPQDAGEC